MKRLLLGLVFALFVYADDNIACQQNGEYWQGEINNYQAQFFFYPQDNKPVLVFLGAAPGQTTQMYNLYGFGPSIFDHKQDIIQNPNPYSASLLFIDIYGAGFSEPQENITFSKMIQDLSHYIQLVLSKDCTGKDLSKSKIYPISSSQGIGLTLELAKKLNSQKVILLSPWSIDQLRHAPQFAHYQGLIDYYERQKMEKLVVETLSSFINSEKYNTVMNNIAKLGGNINRKNIYSVEMNTEKTDLSRYFNNGQFKEEWKISEDQYFYEQNINLFQSLKEYVFENQKQIKANLETFSMNNKVLVIGNQFSLNTNFGGTQDWLNSLNIDNSGSLTLSKDGKFAQREMGNLVYTVIYNSGEEIWRDQPEKLHEMIENFIN